jgi:hypothetical protein
VRELLEARIKDVLGEDVIEISELDLGDSRSFIALTKSYELTIRCANSERCEVMLRYMDNPAVTCTTRCYEDPASSLDRVLLGELKARVEALVHSLGIKLLKLEDLS